MLLVPERFAGALPKARAQPDQEHSLAQKEGNLPETHGVVKFLRRRLDESYPHNFLLAEGFILGGHETEEKGGQMPALAEPTLGRKGAAQCRMCAS